MESMDNTDQSFTMTLPEDTIEELFRERMIEYGSITPAQRILLKDMTVDEATREWTVSFFIVEAQYDA